MPEEGFRAASTPLFEAGLVDVVEWSIDIPWGFDEFRVPEWAEAVCDLYANAGRLYGHGVAFSALSARWERRQEQWLERLGRELARRSYVHVTEHFGFLSAEGFLPSAPLPVPMTEGAVRVGREALGRLADVVGGPVGLENLAPTLGSRDAEDQGAFLEALLAPVDGFLILDLHNVYCQSECLGVPLQTLLERLPLHRVREIHVAGGSLWRPPTDSGRVLRRDTHDGPIPEAVFELLPVALRRCEGAEVVIFERFVDTLGDPEIAMQFQEDFKRLRREVESCHE
jgi:uncharacterized protein (UPF0276 family)